MTSIVDLPQSRAERPWTLARAAASIKLRWTAAWLLSNRPPKRRPDRGVRGRVHLVGAGPGDPDLLTLRAARLIEAAVVILYDSLVDDAILARASKAELVDVGKHAGRPGLTQDAINRLLLSYSLAGRDVVRLKGGDPFIFGRGGEELDYLEARGIEVEVVPGISAALGCAAAARIPLTQRGRASALTLVTGHGRAGGPLLPADIDFRALASASHTVVVYMGRSSAPEFAERLIAAGRSPWTPAALIQDGTLPGERIWRGILTDLGELARAVDPGRPTLIVIGDVAAGPYQGFREIPLPAEEACS